MFAYDRVSIYGLSAAPAQRLLQSLHKRVILASRTESRRLHPANHATTNDFCAGLWILYKLRDKGLYV